MLYYITTVRHYNGMLMLLWCYANVMLITYIIIMCC